MRTKCTYCGQAYRVAETMANARVKCKVCRKSFIVENAESPAADTAVEAAVMEEPPTRTFHHHVLDRPVATGVQGGFGFGFGRTMGGCLALIVAPVIFLMALSVISSCLRAFSPSTSSSTSSGSHFKVTDLDSKITEKNDVYWKCAWSAKVNNATERPQKVFITVQWLDAEGFEVDEQVLEYRLDRGENTVSDATLVRLPGAESIARYEITVEKSAW